MNFNATFFTHRWETEKSLSEQKINAVTMDPHEQHLKVALALEGSLAVLNNQIKHFLFSS